MATGWNKIDGDWYYFHSTGEMATGWEQDGNDWYYLYANGSMTYDNTVDGYYLDKSGKWIANKADESGNSKGTSDLMALSKVNGDNSWKQDCIERGWGPLTKDAYDKKVAEAKSQGIYFPIVHANEFNWKSVVWGSMTGADSIISDGTTLASSVSKNMAKYVYSNSTLTNSSSRIEAYTKMFDIANRADDIRVVSRTLDYGAWKSLSTKIGVGGSVIAGGINIYSDLNNKDYDDKDKDKAVTVDIVTTVVSGIATVGIAACIPGVGWAFAVGIVANLFISAGSEFWKESWIE